MNLKRILDRAWKFVEWHSTGWCNRELMLAGAIAASVGEVVPEHVSFSYDGRRDQRPKSRPNFFFWTKDKNPTVIFASKIRYLPSSIAEIRKDLLLLKEFTHLTEAPVISDTRNQLDSVMQISSEVEIGYFLLTDIPRRELASVIHEVMDQELLARFHFLIGPASEQNGCTSSFDYFQPAC